MVKPERADHMKFPDADKILEKYRLIVGGPGLIELDEVRGGTPWREQKIRAIGLFV
jgi:hypothetical protein